MISTRLLTTLSWSVAAALTAAACATSTPPAPATPAARPASGPAASGIPRLPDGKPNLQGIWQVRNRAWVNLEAHAARNHMPPGDSVVVGDTIPYLPAAVKQRAENYAKRTTEDPLASCYMPGVPRIMYMDHPFQIFQTPNHLAMTFEWSNVFRLIYTDGSKHAEGIEFWMGDSRGHWEGDTLVVEVTNHNDRTWFDMSGNFHSEQLKVVEKYSLADADTLTYEATIEDPKVFSRPWTIRMPLYRQRGMSRLLEYGCQAELEEENGAFERDERTWAPEQP